MSNMDIIKNSESGSLVDLELIPIIVKIPKETANLKLISSLFDEKGIKHEAEINLNVSTIQECRQDFIDFVGDDDYDATYVLTEEGKKYLEELRNKDNA